MEVLTVIQVVLYIVALILGVKFFLIKKSPLYFRLLFYGVACFLLEELYYLIDYACSGSWSDTFSFAAFGASACYAFMLSANYGQFDSFVDDGSTGCKRATKVAFLAPACMVVIYIVAATYYLMTNGNVIDVVLTIVCKLPAFFAAYYHLKHLLLPDVMHFVVDSLRPCNAVCLALIMMDVFSDAFLAFGKDTAYMVCETVLSLMLVLMMIAAERGHKEWKI